MYLKPWRCTLVTVHIGVSARMTNALKPFYHLRNGTASVVIDCRSGQPVLSYFGDALAQLTLAQLTQLDRPEAPASLPVEPSISLTPTVGESYLGHLGLEAQRGHSHWQLRPRVITADLSARQLVLQSVCDRSQVEVTHCVSLHAETRSLELSVSVRNQSTDTSLSLDTCALTLPVPDHLTTFLELSGRWGYEFQSARQTLPKAAYVRENWTGRTSHHMPPSITLMEAHTASQSGTALSLHLGWSGNHQIRVEQLADGRRVVQLGELLRPGEIQLAPGAVYKSPSVFLCHSSEGMNPLIQTVHQMIRSQFGDAWPASSPPRPVQLNTWEALYFDIDETSLIALIDESAALGIERFVVDDGWFLGRHDDKRALGDWEVDSHKLPNGLFPIVAACQAHGMECGLWIEPEMVSANSLLFSEHPDWILNHEGILPNEARYQYVLDLSQEEVTHYLFDKIQKLLSTHDIRYLKWDMNRDIHQAGTSQKHHAIHQQTQALYALLGRIRAAFPNVAIESCASGGGRVDLGILTHVSRFWPSDTNDALDRLRVQRGFLSTFPPELMGSHVGPSPCHITGRQHTMALRAGVALWGHMGVEVDVRQLGTEDRAVLKEAIELHKRHRTLLHNGEYSTTERPTSEMAWSVVDKDQSQALCALAMLETPSHAFPPRYRLNGLDATQNYRVALVWPGSLTTQQSTHQHQLAQTEFSGAWLMSVGLSVPILWPESLLIYHLQAS